MSNTSSISSSCINCDQFDGYFKLIVIGILLTTMAIVGLFFNMCAIIVFSRPQMRRVTSMNAYLCALALSDALIVITAVLLYSLTTIECVHPIVSNVHSRLALIAFPLSTFAQTFSVYMTMAAAVDCCISTLASNQTRKHLCKESTAHLVIIVIMICSIFYNLPHFFELQMWSCYELMWDTNIDRLQPTKLRMLSISSMMQLRLAGLGMNPLYYQIYYTYLYTSFMAIGPLIVLVLLNTAIILHLLFAGGHRTDSSNTITLIIVVVLFITCNVPGLTANIIEMVDESNIYLGYIISISNLLVVFNSSANFIIYMTFDHSFRHTFMRIYRSSLGPPPATANFIITTNDDEIGCNRRGAFFSQL